MNSADKKNSNIKKGEQFYRLDNGILLRMPRQKRYELLGKITSLLLASSLHRQYAINDIGAVFLPPIHLNQFRLYKNSDGDPIALVTWAFFSEEIEKKCLRSFVNSKSEDMQKKDNLKLEEFKSLFKNKYNIGIISMPS